ncbi:MAG TPA: hypothetical protein PKO38_07155 [Bacillota bacterium]|jgi:hypothetical protein|nr:hypothetical protein [Bacillota bacterium]HOB87449.1 hypothetical protein [Bacillota bacterium]HOP68825.1 hypothetical protein [Bacillota bacterium]HPT34143.1 hypothetical protein [Bacillota bacterium]HPZ64026.1 hypothetical protein [Bacillota bacterium]
MNDKLEENRVLSLGHAAIKYGAWLIGLIVVLFFMARHLFPFIQGLF